MLANPRDIRFQFKREPHRGYPGNVDTTPPKCNLLFEGVQTIDGAQVLVIRAHQACACTKIQEGLTWYFCGSFIQYRAEEQPAVQGDLLLVLYIYLAFQQCFPGTVLAPNTSPKKSWLGIPTPQALDTILQDQNKSHLISWCYADKPLGVRPYLALFAQGKLPMERLDTRMYLHDFCNHLLLWLFMSEKVRDAMVERLKIWEKWRTTDNKSNPLWRCLDYILAEQIDSGQGTLNASLLSYMHKSDEEWSKCTNWYKLVHYALNFGILYEATDLNYATLLTVHYHTEFWHSWLQFQCRTRLAEDLEFKSSVPVVSSPDLRNSEYRLALLEVQEIGLDELTRQLFQEIGLDEKKDFKSKAISFVNLGTCQDFRIQVNANLKEFIVNGNIHGGGLVKEE